MGTQVALVRADDWQGFYVNETLVMEDHQIEIQDVMPELVGKIIDRFVLFDADSEWLAECGNFPKSLKEVVLHGDYTVRLYLEKD